MEGWKKIFFKSDLQRFERWTGVWPYLAVQDAASLLDCAQLPGGGWHWRILPARRVPPPWTLCCSHGEQSNKWTFAAVKKKKKNQKTDGTALVGDLKLILSLKYSVYRASRYGAQQRSSAPGWPGWGVMRSEDHQTLFRTVWTTSPQLSHGARLSPSQACWWK